MTDAVPRSDRIRAILRDLARHPIALWAGFVVVHFVLGMLGAVRPRAARSATSRFVYRFWVQHGLEADIWVGIDTAWVYPILALVPMIVAYLFGPDFYAQHLAELRDDRRRRRVRGRHRVRPRSAASRASGGGGWRSCCCSGRSRSGASTRSRSRSRSSGCWCWRTAPRLAAVLLTVADLDQGLAGGARSPRSSSRCASAGRSPSRPSSPRPSSRSSALAPRRRRQRAELHHPADRPRAADRVADRRRSGCGTRYATDPARAASCTTTRRS